MEFVLGKYFKPSRIFESYFLNQVLYLRAKLVDGPVEGPTNGTKLRKALAYLGD